MYNLNKPVVKRKKKNFYNPSTHQENKTLDREDFWGLVVLFL